MQYNLGGLFMIIPANFSSVEKVYCFEMPTSALGQKQTLESGSGMSALSPEADILIVNINVC
jgi:hypothetical protein